MITLGNLLGSSLEEKFMDFDLTEIQQVLIQLKDVNIIDIAHAESLQQQSLRAADIVSELLGKMVKTVAYLETRVNSVKNKVALNYQSPEGKTTADVKKYAAESSPEVEELQIKLAKAKGSKVVLEKKYDILIKSHHQYKDLAMGMRRSILGYGGGSSEKVAEGYE